MIKLYDLIPHAEKAADTLGHLFKFVSLFQNAIDRIESQVKAYFTHNPIMPCQKTFQGLRQTGI
jgi:hypothetical protein